MQERTQQITKTLFSKTFFMQKLCTKLARLWTYQLGVQYVFRLVCIIPVVPSFSRRSSDKRGDASEDRFHLVSDDEIQRSMSLSGDQEDPAPLDSRYGTTVAHPFCTVLIKGASQQSDHATLFPHQQINNVF